MERLEFIMRFTMFCKILNKVNIASKLLGHVKCEHEETSRNQNLRSILTNLFPRNAQALLDAIFKLIY